MINFETLTKLRNCFSDESWDYLTENYFADHGETYTNYTDLIDCILNTEYDLKNDFEFNSAESIENYANNLLIVTQTLRILNVLREIA
jgi:hypothetical protein